MSDTRLLKVLRTKVAVYGDHDLEQLIVRAKEAADRIELDAMRIAALEAERDALSAHVERLQSAVRAAKTPSGVIHVCETWMIDTHQASLARLKAQWQAEALERHAEGLARDNEPTDMVCVEDVHTLLLHEASELRHQAEADQ